MFLPSPGTVFIAAAFLVSHALAGIPYEACTTYYGNTVYGPDGVCGGLGAPCETPTQCANYGQCGTDGFCGGVGGRCLAPGDYYSYGDTPFPCLPQFWCGGESYGLDVAYRTCSECPIGTITLASGVKPFCACNDKTKFFDYVSRTCSCAEGFVLQPDGTCLACPGNAVDKDTCTCGASAVLTVVDGALVCECYGGYYFNSDGQSCTACNYPGTINSASTGDNCLCPTGTFFFAKSSDCLCPNGQTYSFDSGTCQDCPAGQSTPPLTADLTYGFNTCACPATSFIPDYTTQACVPCPTGSSPGYSGASYCDCPTGKSFSSTTGQCFNCPTGSTGFGTACQCNNPNEAFDSVLEVCYTCPSDSTSPFGTFCRCNDPSKHIVTSSTGVRSCACSDGTTSCACLATKYRNTVSGDCSTCPSGSIKTADGLSCVCVGTSALFDPTNNICVTCPSDSVIGSASNPKLLCTCKVLTQFYDETTNTCVCPFGTTLKTISGATNCVFACPFGTTPSGDGLTCTCLNPSFTFCPSTMSCFLAGTSPTSLPRSKAKRQAREQQRLLKSYQGAPWQDLPHSALCPNNQMACGIAPALANFECLDVMTEVESCGGCASTGEGANCFQDIPGVLSATCDRGVCVALSCQKKFTLVELADGVTFCDNLGQV